MNIVSKLTLRHIMGHKRRSLLTIMAIIVSVAMVTAVFTSIFSFLQFMLDSTLAYDGNWHAQLSYESKPDSAQFDTDKYDYYMCCGYFGMRYDENVTAEKASTEIDIADASVVEMRNIRIIEGRFPEKDNEILISKKYIERNGLSWKLGDTIRVYCEWYTENKERVGGYREFVITAIAEGNVSFFDYRGAVIANTGNIGDESSHWTVTVRQKPLNKEVYDNINKLAEQTGAYNTSFNRDLLNYSGYNTDETLKIAIGSFAAILLTVIVVASVIMIYDSFAVSYQERERYLGMLASVGATKRQKRSSIYFEGLILGLVGIPLGILAGIIGMAVTFKCIEGAFLTTVTIPIQETLRVHINIWVMIGTVLISAFTIFVSCYIPARRASKTSPIAAIKGTNTVKVKKAKKLRVSGLTRKLYGYEGELAVKNFKRNGRRSRTIIFALIISVVLFLAATNFSQIFEEMVKQGIGEGSADFNVRVQANGVKTIEDYFKGANIEGYYGEHLEFGYIKDESVLTEKAKEHLYSDEEGWQFGVYFMDDSSFDAYAKSIGEDPASYHAEGSLKGILYDCTSELVNRKILKHNAFNADAVQNRFRFYLEEYDKEKRQYVAGRACDVTVGKLTQADYDSIMFLPKNSLTTYLILPMSTMNRFGIDLSQTVSTYGVFAKDYNAEIRKIEAYFEQYDYHISVSDNGAQMQQINALISIIKVFIYGFITLITLIAVINIINSIANSMNERRTEFAMMKSVGMTPKGFKKMIYVESIRYGVHALLWAIPISAGLHYLMYRSLVMTEKLDIPFKIYWPYDIAAVLSVFGVIVLALIYSADKIKSRTIIEDLKSD